MAVNLVELVASTITPDVVQAAARALEERDSAVQSGITALVPALIGGLAARTSTPSGASKLIEMLNHADLDEEMMGKVGSMLSSGQADALLAQGSGLLGGLFGANKASSMAGTLAGMTGMKAGSATNLLMIIVPMVLGVVKRFIGEERLGPAEVGSMFAEQKKFLEGRLDPRLTSAMGFVTPTGMLAGLGRTAEGAEPNGFATMHATTAASSRPQRSWLPWALAAGVAAVLLTALPRFADRGGPSLAQAPATTSAAPGSSSASGVTPMSEPSTAPTSTAMGAAGASLPARIYFETGKAELGPDGIAVVKSVVGMLASNPSAKVDLTSFIDKAGDAAAKQELAQKRVSAVRAALEAGGVAPDRVAVKQPMTVEIGAAGSDAEARRVEIAAAK